MVTGTLWRDNENVLVIDSIYGRLTYAKEDLTRVEVEESGPVISRPETPPPPLVTANSQLDTTTSSSAPDTTLPLVANLEDPTPSLPSDSEKLWIQGVLAVISSVSSSVRALWPSERGFPQVEVEALKRGLWEVKEQSKRLSSLRAPSKRLESATLLLENAGYAFKTLPSDLPIQDPFAYGSVRLSRDQMTQLDKGYFFIWQALWELMEVDPSINCAYVNTLFVTPGMQARRSTVHHEVERELANMTLRAAETYLRDMFISAKSLEYPDLADKVYRKPRLQPVGIKASVGHRIYSRGKYAGTVIGVFDHYYDSDTCSEYPFVVIARPLIEGETVKPVVERHSFATMRSLSHMEIATDPIVLDSEAQVRFEQYCKEFADALSGKDAVSPEQKPIDEPRPNLRSLGGRIDVGVRVYRGGKPYGVVTGFTTNRSGARFVEITELDGSVSTFERSDLIRNSGFSTPDR